MLSWTAVLWAIQTKLRQEDSTAHLVSSFHKFGLSWAAFPYPPMVGEVPSFPWDGPIIYYGSTKLVQTVNDTPELKAKAAFFYDPLTHSVSWYGPRFGDDYLNVGATRMTTGEVLALPDATPEMFIRPDVGIKLFAGKVMDVVEFRRLCKQETKIGAHILDEHTDVYVNDPLQITAEVRTWVIGGKVAAMVGYRWGGRIDPWSMSQDEQGEKDLSYNEIREFAEAQAAKIPEVGAVVLDVAILPVGAGVRGAYELKVVEINCIHSSGFYLTDPIDDVVAELTNYVRATCPWP